MSYVLIALLALVFISAVGSLVYLELLNRKLERAETERFQAMTLPELTDALVQAELVRDSAFEDYKVAYGRWRSYKWGYRRNPYYGRYLVARSLHARSCRRVEKLEALIREKSNGK
jgi:hypothetical protein